MSWRVPYLAKHGATSTDVTLAAPFRRWFLKKSHDITWNGIAKWRDSRKMDCWLQFSSEIPWMDSGCGRLQVTVNSWVQQWPCQAHRFRQNQCQNLYDCNVKKTCHGSQECLVRSGCAGWGLGVGSMVYWFIKPMQQLHAVISILYH